MGTSLNGTLWSVLSQNTEGVRHPKFSIQQAAAGSQGSGGRLNRDIVQWRWCQKWPIDAPLRAS